jgi:plastocyanin
MLASHRTATTEARGIERMKRLLTAAGVALLAVLLVACGSGGSAGPSGPPASVDPNALTISANNLQFSTDRLEAPAGEAFQIVFDNQEAAPHNVAIYTDQSAAQKVLVEEPFSGPKVVTYNVPALEAREYFFRCDIHPEMKGTLVAS